jgi:site-specific recombinase XerC
MADPKPLTLAPYIDRYLTSKRKQGALTPDTARKYGYRLAGLAESFGARPLDQFKRRAVERWLDHLDRLNPNSRRLHLSTARSFCRWLIDVENAIAADPTAGLRVTKIRAVPRALRAEQITRLLDHVDDRRGHTIIALMLGMGLRCVEVARLQVGDYDPRRATMLIVGKGRHERLLPVPAETARAVDAYIRAEGISYGPLIRSKSHPARGITPLHISTMMSKLMRRAGIKGRPFDGVSGHALRHTCASDVLDRSGSLVVVQEMLGHADLNTTRIYLRGAGLEEMRRAMEGRDYQAG